jgi:hypothetical protein
MGVGCRPDGPEWARMGPRTGPRLGPGWAMREVALTAPDLDAAQWGHLLDEAAAGDGAAPERICRLCVQTLQVGGAGISMVTAAGDRRVVCATDEVSTRIEDLQLTLGEGPCIDAIRGGLPVLIADLQERDDLAVERWPAFMRSAAEAGVRALFAFPLRIGGINVGALDLYRDGPGELTSADLRAALMAAEVAATALLREQPGVDGSVTPAAQDAGAAWQMQVHQATGMVMIQAGVPVEEAFLMLRARAFAIGRPLTELASEVVERRLRFSGEAE